MTLMHKNEFLFCDLPLESYLVNVSLAVMLFWMKMYFKQLFVDVCVQASTFQMAILLQYNHADNFSVQQLQENTQIDMVVSMLNSLSCSC